MCGGTLINKASKQPYCSSTLWTWVLTVSDSLESVVRASLEKSMKGSLRGVSDEPIVMCWFWLIKMERRICFELSYRLALKSRLGLFIQFR